MRIRALSLFVATAVAAVASSVTAEPKLEPAKAAAPTPGKGFWKILVKPKAKWTLYMGGETKKRADSDYNPDPITIETYDVRKIGDADVARLRWRQGDDTDSPLSMTRAPRLDQFAVTPAGLYILNADMDDQKIAEVLKGKPSRSDPPKAYKGTKVNEGRYLEIRVGKRK